MMKEFIEDNLILSAVIVVFVGVGLMVIGSRWDELQEERFEAEINETSETERMAQVRQLHYQDPVAALEILRAVIQSPTDETERAQAKEQLPSVLGLCLYNELEEGHMQEAEVYLQELKSDWAEHSEYNRARRKLGETVRKQWRSLDKEDRDGEADAVFSRVVQEDLIFGDTYFLREYQKSKLELMDEALQRRDLKTAQRYLMTASRVLVTATPNSKLTQGLRQRGLIGKELCILAEDMWKKDEKELTVPLYQTARWQLTASADKFGDPTLDDDWERRDAILRRIEERIIDALVYIGDELSEGRNVVITTLKPLDIYRDAASNTSSAALRLTPLRRKMDYEIADLFEFTEPMDRFKVELVAKQGYLTQDDVDLIYDLSHDARNQATDILEKSAVRVWEAMLADENFDPWSQVDVETVRAVDQKVGRDAGEQARRDELVRMAHRDEYRVPLTELDVMEELLYETLGRWGLLYVDGNTQEGFRILRRAMRGTKTEWLREDIADGLRELIRNSLKERDFEQLYELAGFYAGEVGVDNLGGSYREEFRTTLQKAAKYFEKKSQMKYIFMQALIAESFPEERIGREARAEAIRLGFEHVSGETEEDSTMVGNEPSGLDGYSVIAVDNSTQYHLLAFYDGPETFFVRFSPYRKGTVVLKDGEYKLAVITPSGDIFPYRGRRTLNSELATSDYQIETSGSEDIASGSAARGKYTLLRQPEEAGSLKVHADTGAVMLWVTAREGR